MVDKLDILYNISEAVKRGASDIFILPGMPFSYKLNNALEYIDDVKIMPNNAEEIINKIYELASNRDKSRLVEHGDDDFSFSIQGVSRFRISVMKQRGSYAAIIRVVKFELPDFTQLHIPEQVMQIANMTQGLVLVTGPAGSGKSTTLASIVDRINTTKSLHVITLEDPIEYLYKHKLSAITQREIGADTDTYLTGLRAALRQSPDVILIGEMRDYATIQTAMTAAETGHLVISTLHTLGAANSIDRIIDSFPTNQQEQIRLQLSMVLQCVVSQQLIPRVDENGLIPAWEIMFVDESIRNLIRDSRLNQIDGIIQTSSTKGCLSLQNSLYDLYKRGIISKESAILKSKNRDAMEKKISRG